MKKLVLLLSVVFASSGYAGGGTVGNGGVGVVCKAAKGETVELLDFYEGRTLKKLIPLPSQKTYLDLAKDKVAELQQVTGDVYSLPSLSESLLEIKNKIHFLPTGSRLALTQDLDTEVAPPAGCSFAQIVNYTNDGAIYVVLEYWNKMDDNNKAALLTHETLYAYLRLGADEPSARRTRKTIALIFSGQKLSPQAHSTPGSRDIYFCEDAAGVDPLARTTFTLSRESDGRYVVQFGKIAGMKTIDREYVNLRPDQVGADSDDPLRIFNFTGRLISQIDSDLVVMMYASPVDNKLVIVNSRTHQRKVIQMNCESL